MLTRLSRFETRRRLIFFRVESQQLSAMPNAGTRRKTQNINCSGRQQLGSISKVHINQQKMFDLDYSVQQANQMC